MNEPLIDEEAIAATDPRVSGSQRLLQDRTTILLAALGAGLVIGLIARALRPEPTAAQRLAHLVADLEERVRDTARPTWRRTRSYAHDGAGLLRDGLHEGEVRVAGLLKNAADGVRKLFS